MRQDEGAVKWLLGDHLGSTSLVYDGSQAIRQGYKAWGETRFGGVPTKYQYTGQMNEEGLGLYYYGSRWYDPSLGRWIQPDQIIPDPYNSLDWDRYQYVRCNPIGYIDPDGHFAVPLILLSYIPYIVIGLAALATAAIVFNAIGGPEAVEDVIVEVSEMVSEQVESTVEGLTNLYENLESSDEITSIEVYFSKKKDLAFVDYLVKKYRLSKSQREELHRLITKQHMTEEEIEKEAAEIARIAREVVIYKERNEQKKENQEKMEENNKAKTRRR